MAKGLREGPPSRSSRRILDERVVQLSESEKDFHSHRRRRIILLIAPHVTSLSPFFALNRETLPSCRGEDALHSNQISARANGRSSARHALPDSQSTDPGRPDY